MNRKSKFILKTLVTGTYAIPLLFVTELLITEKVIYTAIYSAVLVFILLPIRNREGEKIFTTDRLRRVGPLFYFPLGIIDDM